jgi:hypothetical protein
MSWYTASAPNSIASSGTRSSGAWTRAAPLLPLDADDIDVAMQHPCGPFAPTIQSCDQVRSPLGGDELLDGDTRRFQYRSQMVWRGTFISGRVHRRRPHQPTREFACGGFDVGIGHGTTSHRRLPIRPCLFITARRCDRRGLQGGATPRRTAAPDVSFGGHAWHAARCLSVWGPHGRGERAGPRRPRRRRRW